MKARIRKESDGTWSRNVWFGGGIGMATNKRRYFYVSREAACLGDISDNIGKNGRVK